ncbi:acetoin utilization protein AcuC [Isoptericola variabilis]|uniref:Acetoin utilization protein AcuC n=1 Tax=Isoptericola variabilis (strain 225) TaxID=743718 RepID=F6FUT2_ISOV2|nr:acetoin utilization protein AcuC [Isoptericola variabilis]AEG43343.1 Histone deacetylase [Isoptericola variabilis 225]TWH35281.1 acetoin utilization protein AcuC [Isoptericola variabilis J7]
MRVARLLWSPELLRYDFGPGHPMAPARLDLTMRLARELGLLDAPGLEVSDVVPASDEVLRTVHDADYVDAVRRAAATGEPDRARGLGTEDDPVFPGMHEAAARIVAASVDAAESVWAGGVLHGVNVAGGMHHARRDAASGFCIYNDAAAAVQRLLDLGAERVAYVDLDAHHGDGVETAFWDDDRVLTVSVHQDGHTLFPGTGSPADAGGDRAPGTAVNVALPPRTDGPRWLRAIDAVVPAVLRELRPQAIVSQHGCDAHGNDPLTDLDVGVEAQVVAARWVHDLAHELCDGRWVALGGGGYAVVDVVPLVWSALVAEAVHAPLEPGTPLPEGWCVAVEEISGLPAARTLGAGPVEFRPWGAGFDPADAVDRAVLATRRSVFPHWGLDTMLD